MKELLIVLLVIAGGRVRSGGDNHEDDCDSDFVGGGVARGD
jgi:hypothetical protein